MSDVPEKSVSCPCAPDELFPSREALTLIEQLLTRFQFQCEEAGLWPGSLSLPELGAERPGGATATGLAAVLGYQHGRLRGDDRNRGKSRAIIPRAGPSTVPMTSNGHWNVSMPLLRDCWVLGSSKTGSNRPRKELN